MKYATIHADDAAIPGLIAVIEERRGWWSRLGADLFLCVANDGWPGLARALQDAGHVPGGQGSVRQGALWLVVQKGRAFQREHPGARVLLDKGRYLVAELTKAQAERMAAQDEGCFQVRPLPRNAAVFQTHVPRRARAMPPAAPALVAGVQDEVFRQAITHLVSYRTRHSTSPDYAQAAAWAQAQFQALGLAAETVPITVGGGTSANVIATKPGLGPDAGEVLLVGHLDSVNHPGGPDAPAPGADDNASGSAGVLTLAAAAAAHDFAHDLTFILFGGEEQGLHGSTQYVAGLEGEARARIRAVLNMDMIGSVNAHPPSVLLEGAALSQPLIDRLAEAAGAFTDLEVQVSLQPFGSDHMPFLDAGIPAVLTIEGTDGANDAIHTANDLLDRIDMGYALQILRMNAGWLAQEAGLAEPALLRPDAPAAGCGNAGPAAFDQAVLAAQNQLAGHYQALLAQYARLDRDGLLAPGDLVERQSLWALCDHLRSDCG